MSSNEMICNQNMANGWCDGTPDQKGFMYVNCAGKCITKNIITSGINLAAGSDTSFLKIAGIVFGVIVGLILIFFGGQYIFSKVALLRGEGNI